MPEHLTTPGSPAGAREVSVVVPVFNRWPDVLRTVHSALEQRGVDHEVIVVDDGSSDGTLEHLRELSHPRLSAVLLLGGSGAPAGPRNLGTQHASGRYVSFLDHDDVWAPDKLRHQLDAVRAAGAAWAYSGVVVVDHTPQVVGVLQGPRPERLPAELLDRNAVPGGGSNVLAETELVRRAGGFDDSLRLYEDWEMWIRLSQLAPAARVDAEDIAYQQHTDNKSVLEVDRQVDALRRLAAKHAGMDPARALAWRWIADSRRRSGDRRGAARTYLELARRRRSPGDVARALDALTDVSGRLRRRPSGPSRSLPPWFDETADAPSHPAAGA